jgi:hypothetical protein
MLWDEAVIQVSSIVATEFCISDSIQIRQTGVSLKITSIYGLTAYAHKDGLLLQYLLPQLVRGEV